ncbi:MAG: hypothetical protein K2F90_02725 [Clostridiales bacterium]|nr:hypothetical protein [Clostridiales bacterium]
MSNQEQSLGATRDTVYDHAADSYGTLPEHLWKQSSSVIVGDTVYLYLAAPYSCIKYKCEAVEVNIPYDYADDNVSMNKVMKIRRLHTYADDEFGIARLKRRGVASVRGPRSIPYRLRTELEESSGDRT